MIKQSLNSVLAAILLFVFAAAHAQDRSSTKNLSVYVSKMQQSADALNLFLALNNATVYRTDLNTNRYYCQFALPLAKVGALDSIAAKMGYITQNSFNAENLQEKIANLERRNQSLNFEIETYTKQLKDTFLSGNMASDIRRRISNNLQSIATNDININQYRLTMAERTCLVEFNMYDELSTPSGTKLSFVNMPGVEYSFLAIENPKAGVSAKAYQGASVKYMFTRGKSYFNLGVYKALNNNKADSSAISELFMINFGQDFYPRNFGRGKRRYFNLYTGYQVGGFIASRNDDKSSKFIYNANLSLGLELVKTKHVLIDNKVSYFLPLNELNRHMRGLLYQASFNFVF